MVTAGVPGTRIKPLRAQHGSDTAGGWAKDLDLDQPSAPRGRRGSPAATHRAAAPSWMLALPPSLGAPSVQPKRRRSVTVGCRLRCAHPSCRHDRCPRSRGHRDPCRFRAARRVRGRCRAAPAVPRRHRHRASPRLAPKGPSLNKRVARKNSRREQKRNDRIRKSRSESCDLTFSLAE